MSIHTAAQADVPGGVQSFSPDWALPPGRLLRAEIEACGMTQSDLAARAKLTEKHVSQVITGTVSLTPDVALAFERSLGVPASTLLRAEANYQSLRSRAESFTKLSQYTSWAQQFPLRELRGKGVLRGTEQGGELVDALLRFFGVADPVAFEKVSLAGISGFRRAQHLEVDRYATAAWLRLGERQTAGYRLPQFDAQRLDALLPNLRKLSKVDDGSAFATSRRLLGTCGVALAFVDGIKQSRACGATRWVTAARPLIVLSDRYGYRDTFWFSLFHEIGHVLKHARRRTFVNLVDDGDDADGLESEANAFAAETLVPAPLVNLVLAANTRAKLEAIAIQADVDVSIIAGRRGHLTQAWNKVASLRKTLEVSAIVQAAATPLDPVG
jgi:HTH-type transcriptional regulator/antitoxin HigA